ncbi:hypothetical protein [Nodularia spumigena]|uniref:hypothetical protein n=1 Tax=Nodularia spumigena TaxID=70799 RepID=UPI00232B6857|nr:hypothetical protein [Nodularia spumigena]MDB9317427.1 hypothetical protein [Nodularia spumigena CS-590/01A]MDB9327697.1 hypothetical protein [Nodularia spumigena CS-590/02]MDB9336986.1 hypothetical protein [Nodularia spumigena CS-590/01]MDB9347301.1 hypothetical protein [Nodularia spumigena CS-588/01]MDB9354402.1 hypothetical protein [Nodularia spumigena CS-588/05]
MLSTPVVWEDRLLVIGYWLLVIGHWSLVIGHWSLVIGHLSLVIGRWSLVIADKIFLTKNVETFHETSLHG